MTTREQAQWLLAMLRANRMNPHAFFWPAFYSFPARSRELFVGTLHELGYYSSVSRRKDLAIIRRAITSLDEPGA